MAIRSFRNKATEDIHYGRATKTALKLLPLGLHRKAQIKMAIIAAADSLQDMREIRGNRFEALQGNRSGQFSIRINNRYRICFQWERNQAFDVEVVDYH